MSETATHPLPGQRSIAEILTLGFGVVVAMWAVGYVGRLPSVMAPGALLFPLFLACVGAGGFLAGRYTSRGWLGGVQVGLLSGIVNLLVLGSLPGSDSSNPVVPSAIAWIPGFIAASAAVGGVGAAFAGGGATPTRLEPAVWGGLFVRVAVGATLLLLAVGGLVTTNEAGLAVVDWPNSYGYNMFLLPLSRMTGGIYYEHAHRLFGALVGLTTLAVAMVLHRVDDRAWLRRLAWGALLMVIVQGILGGLRVTGRFTLSTSPEEMAPSITLAAVHGVLGQIFLATMVALGVFTTRGWRTRPSAAYRDSARTDRSLCTVLVVLLIAQIVLGAVQRHLHSGLMIHMSVAVIVMVLALASGARAWGLNPSDRLLRNLGHAVMYVTMLQLVLGVLAFVATGLEVEGEGLSLFQVTAATIHQWCGAVLLGCAVALMLWTYRLLPGRGGPSPAADQ